LKEEANNNEYKELLKLTIIEFIKLIIALLESNPATIIINTLDKYNLDRRPKLLLAFNTII
jgi:hypothetical protein